MTTPSKDFPASHKKIWEKNARQNAMWAVISDPQKTQGAWNKDEFFASGESDIKRFLDERVLAGLAITNYDDALDFGCGVGRLTRALASRFQNVVGIDISEGMIEQAKALNADVTNVDFLAMSSSQLEILGDKRFDFILSLMVIQHIPPSHSLHYLKTLLGLLKPGGAMIVQIPSHRVNTLKNNVRAFLPERLFRLKHALLKRDIPYITMYGLTQARIHALVDGCATIVGVHADGCAGDDWVSYTYVIQKQHEARN